MMRRPPAIDVGVALISVCLILGKLAQSSFHSGLALLPPPVTGLLEQPAWHVPLSEVLELTPGSAIALSIAFGAIVSTMLIRTALSRESWEQLPIIAGFSLLLHPAEILCGLCLILVTRVREAPDSIFRSWKLVGVAILASLITLEFGLIFALVLTTILSAFKEQGSGVSLRQAVPAIAFLALMCGAIVFLPGFGPALARPVSWIWLRPPEEMAASLTPFGGAISNWILVLFVAIPLGIASRSDYSRRHVFIGLGTVWFALLSERYAATALSILLLSSPVQAPTKLNSQSMNRLMIAGVVFAALFGLHSVGWTTILAGQPAPRFVDPTRWDSQGAVVLLNLDRAEEWQTPAYRKKFSLLEDDRWDAWPGNMHEFYSFCDDLRAVRDNRYLRSDGTWGGYLPELKRWSPALLVIESREVESIRQLSLSPDWRVMGIDGGQTIFGRVGDPRNASQMRHALECLMTLEWPARLDQFSLDNTLMSGNSEDDLAVAGALCSLRFPYAALRFSRYDKSHPTLRARCLLELAHRVASHSSAGSLLDQYRAVLAVRHALSVLPRNSSESTSLKRGLEGVLKRTKEQSEKSPENERVLVTAVLTGDSKTVQNELKQLNSPVQDFYHLILRSPDLSPEQLVAEFENVIPRLEGNLPSRGLSEVQFYLGCAALEAGQLETAIPAFVKSAETDPDSPFREIRQLYLQQLRR